MGQLRPTGHLPSTSSGAQAVGEAAFPHRSVRSSFEPSAHDLDADDLVASSVDWAAQSVPLADQMLVSEHWAWFPFTELSGAADMGRPFQ